MKRVTNVRMELNKHVQLVQFLGKGQVNVILVLLEVIIPTINDGEENIEKLNEIVEKYTCIDKVELLPFKKICQTKYDSMKIEFPFAHLHTPTKETMTKLNKLLK